MCNGRVRKESEGMNEEAIDGEERKEVMVGKEIKVRKKKGRGNGRERKKEKKSSSRRRKK